MVFDPTALADATSIMTFFVILPWIPVFLIAKRKPGLPLFALTSVCAWLLLGTSFYFVDAAGDAALIGRAAVILGDGQDLIFEPVVIPTISMLSGIVYCLAMWSLQLFKNHAVPHLSWPQGAQR